MFIWLNKQGVRSDSGFELQFTGHSAAEYREYGKVMDLYLEGGFKDGTPCEIAYAGSFERYRGETGVTISPEDQARIINNVREAMIFQGLELKVKPGRVPDY